MKKLKTYPAFNRQGKPVQVTIPGSDNLPCRHSADMRTFADGYRRCVRCLESVTVVNGDLVIAPPPAPAPLRCEHCQRFIEPDGKGGWIHNDRFYGCDGTRTVATPPKPK